MRGDTAIVASLPADWRSGRFLGRVETHAGPSPVLVLEGEVFDMSQVAPTVSALVEAGDFSGKGGTSLGALDAADIKVLSPVDLQCVKACGVTFAVSAVERVIEERARGDWAAAGAIRDSLEARVGGSIRSVQPGSSEAAELKAALVEAGLWSQYLEVAIGPDAEVFTKAPVLSTVGPGDEIGIRSDSSWNNPEPEIALLVDSKGQVVGACLGNDVNLRDFEGRSALLLGKAKDNNASCSLGPLVRLFDDSFTIDDVRKAEVKLIIAGEDNYRLEGASNMAEISRDPLDLVKQTLSEHQYPDGFVLFLGTLFAPVQDRDEPGRGFTHKVGDTVTIESDRLGRLVNRVVFSRDAAPWELGIGAFIANLAKRGLLGHAA
ncbi:fumarylacetoacetate hydrolase family protein [Sphingomonas sp. BAUL-RG-20F-R05-02]|uniref:fumarylacetoacetate hydrolase family protein n=1 Tax=Sphingomonas sp. BAUL-RG-20F-R05-02 TaxID=2914830 RepID=UPI001F5900AB|nr:fumarylacetoacetate hydrolase family protein [Sphingomonas sp. BAUL-RG-20F-R05-02]